MKEAPTFLELKKRFTSRLDRSLNFPKFSYYCDKEELLTKNWFIICDISDKKTPLLLSSIETAIDVMVKFSDEVVKGVKVLEQNGRNCYYFKFRGGPKNLDRYFITKSEYYRAVSTPTSPPTIPSPPEGEGGRSPDEGYNQQKPTSDNQSPGIVKGEALDTIQGGRAGNLADPCQNSEKPKKSTTPSIDHHSGESDGPQISGRLSSDQHKTTPYGHCEEPQVTKQSPPKLPSPLEGEGGRSPDEGYNQQKPTLDNQSPGIVKGEALDTIQGGRAGNLADPCQNSEKPKKSTIPSPTEGEGGRSPDEGSSQSSFDIAKLFPMVADERKTKARNAEKQRQLEFEERLKHMTVEEVIVEYNKLMPEDPLCYIDGRIEHINHLIKHRKDSPPTSPSTDHHPGKSDGPQKSGGLSSDQHKTAPYGHCEKPQATWQSQPKLPSPPEGGHPIYPRPLWEGDRGRGPTNLNSDEGYKNPSASEQHKNNQPPRFHPRTTRWKFKFLPPKRPPPDSS